VGDATAVTLGVGDGSGVAVILGVGDGSGVGVAEILTVGVGAGAALLILTPLLQVSFFPFLMQVYFFSLATATFPAFEQEDPVLIGAADITWLDERTRTAAIRAIPALRFIRLKDRTTLYLLSSALLKIWIERLNILRARR
jgi:hypothetical protein